MVRHSVLAEEDALESKVKILRTKTIAEVGLVLGLCSSGSTTSRDLVLELVATPLQEDFFSTKGQSSGSNAKKKGKTSTTSSQEQLVVQLDNDWIGEHASQIDRMLPGGVTVLGIYVFLPEATFKASSASTQILTALKLVAKLTYGTERKHMIVLHLDSTSRKMSAKTLPLDGSGQTFSPCELKFSKIQNNLVSVKSSYEITDASLVTTTAKGLRREVLKMQERIAQSLKSMVIKIKSKHGSTLVDSSTAESSVIDFLKSGKTQESLEVDIFCPLASNLHNGNTGQGAQLQGSMKGSGYMDLIAYVYSRDSVASLVSALRMDIIRSVKARADTYLDDTLASVDEQDDSDIERHPFLEAENDGKSGLLTQFAFQLPSRSLVTKTVQSGEGVIHFNLVYSDYSFPSLEGIDEEQSIQKISELLGFSGFEHMSNRESKIKEQQVEYESNFSKGAQESTKGMSCSTSSDTQNPAALFLGALMALLAIIVYFLLK